MKRKFKKILKLMKNPREFLKKLKYFTMNRRLSQKNYDLILRYHGKKNKINLDILKDDFDIEYIISKLSQLDIQALYIQPIKKNFKWVIAIKDSKRDDFFYKFMNFIYHEAFNIEYKHKGTQKKANSVKKFWFDFSILKRIDIRLDTLRSVDNPVWFRLEVWDEFEEFYLSPTANHISRKLWKSTAKKHNIFTDNSIINYNDILNMPHEEDVSFDIDLVFTWVNADDEDWQKMYYTYKPNLNTDATSTSRFLNRDELKYALRSWDKYGKFIRNIYIVSNCKPPKWLNLSKENIKWIFHEEIMPLEVLPTFSSHAIETSLHKIKGLSNHFIYSNDDVLLLRPTFADDFFYSNGIVKLKFEPYGNVNGELREGDPDYLNAARNVNRLLERDFKKSLTSLHTHSSQAMRIDVLSKMEEQYFSEFQKTMKNKFRTMNDISVASYMYPHFALLSGNALQTNIKTEFIQQRHDFQKKLKTLIDLKNKGNFNKLPLSVCLNDGADSHLNKIWNIEIVKFLNSFFPEKSQYELIN